VNEPVAPRLSRRAFVARCAIAVPLSLLAVGSAGAQPNSTVNMNGDFYTPVRPAPKPDAVAQLDETAVIALEKNLACPCPCSLDIYTCRTTDVTCTNSPAIHRDIILMVDGGYTGDEIVAQLSGTYGQRIRLVPSKSGFNLVAWFLPFVAVGTGGLVIAKLVHTWRRNAEQAAHAVPRDVRTIPVQGTDDELARLNAALRDDSR
jgi:cytochrome c-type biogenesis protein CcmH